MVKFLHTGWIVTGEGAMSLMDVLRKLGIVRMGAVSGTYRNAKERPIELQMDGVFDAKKDLINSPAEQKKAPPPLPPSK